MGRVARLPTAKMETATAGVEAKQPVDAKPKTKIVITPPRFQYATIRVEGTAPYMSNAMSSDARWAMREGQEAGTKSRGMKKNRPPKDFEAQFRGSLHISTEGWYGIPCSSFRGSMIAACTTVGFAMTTARKILFVEPDGYDRETGDPLVRIVSDRDPVRDERIGKLASGVSDILTRGRFDKWSALVKLKWDADFLQAVDVVNLLARAGVHVGVGAGRPGSSKSHGIGMGTFNVVPDE